MARGVGSVGAGGGEGSMSGNEWMSYWDKRKQYDDARNTDNERYIDARNRQSTDDNDRRMMLQSLYSRMTSGGGSPDLGAAPTFELPGEISYDDVGIGDKEAAANAATFGQAKEGAANNARASLMGLRQALGARGMAGAGYEAGQIGQSVASASDVTGRAITDQAVQGYKRSAQVADNTYTGRIQQRGQTMSGRESQARLAADDRRLRLDAYNSQQNRLQEALMGLMRQY